MDNNTTYIHFKKWKCIAQTDRYQNGRLAIILIDTIDGSPVARATVNLPDTSLDENEVIIKDWSENEGMLDTLFAASIIDEVSFEVETGHVTAKVCKLTEEFMDKHNIKSTVEK